MNTIRKIHYLPSGFQSTYITQNIQLVYLSSFLRLKFKQLMKEKRGVHVVWTLQLCCAYLYTNYGVGRGHKNLEFLVSSNGYPCGAARCKPFFYAAAVVAPDIYTVSPSLSSSISTSTLHFTYKTCSTLDKRSASSFLGSRKGPAAFATWMRLDVACAGSAVPKETLLPLAAAVSARHATRLDGTARTERRQVGLGNGPPADANLLVTVSSPSRPPPEGIWRRAQPARARRLS
jgi:hypothetical protein